MTFQQRSIVVSLTSSILILVFYLVSWLRMYQTKGLDSGTIFRLWGVMIVATVIFNIAGNILTSILGAIVHAIQTQSEQPERMVEDERDKLIGLKGTQLAYIAFALGVFFAMLSFVFGQPDLVMFSLIILFGSLAEIAGDTYKLYLYGRGI
jgi:galactitol-specific phosphotransferase system IIC component